MTTSYARRIVDNITADLLRAAKLFNLTDDIAAVVVKEGDDDGSFDIEVSPIGLYITTGWPIERKSLGTDYLKLYGFRVWFLHVHAAGRYNPEEQEDVTLTEVLSSYEAVESLIQQAVAWKLVNTLRCEAEYTE